MRNLMKNDTCGCGYACQNKSFHMTSVIKYLMIIDTFIITLYQKNAIKLLKNNKKTNTN